jgi:hypothetical protein
VFVFHLWSNFYTSTQVNFWYSDPFSTWKSQHCLGLPNHC